MKLLGKIYLVILIAAFLEAVLNFRVIFVKLELVLVSLIYFSLKINPRGALALGGFAGLLKDIISVSPWGEHILLFSLMAFGLSSLKKFFYEIPDYLPIAASVVAIFLYSFIAMLIKILPSGQGFGLGVFFYLFLIILVNTALSFPLFRILKKCA